jgi:hypothetical protein
LIISWEYRVLTLKARIVKNPKNLTRKFPNAQRDFKITLNLDVKARISTKVERAQAEFDTNAGCT